MDGCVERERRERARAHTQARERRRALGGEDLRSCWQVRAIPAVVCQIGMPVCVLVCVCVCTHPHIHTDAGKERNSAKGRGVG